MKRTLVIILIILGILFRIWASQPTWMQWDENYYINLFQNFVDRGELTPYMWRLGSETAGIAALLFGIVTTSLSPSPPIYGSARTSSLTSRSPAKTGWDRVGKNNYNTNRPGIICMVYF